MREIETPRGIARVHEHVAEDPVALLLLGHGAGGSVTAPDLQRVTNACVAAGISVGLVEQPYRVRGSRSAPPAAHLDDAFVAVAAQSSHLPVRDCPPDGTAANRDGSAAGVPLFCGGRSSGARVACRTARAVGARGVVCLAFPLITPKGVSRQDELDGAGVPVLVVQGANDRFGMPAAGPDRTVVTVPGDHGLKRDLDDVAAAVVRFVTALV